MGKTSKDQKFLLVSLEEDKAKKLAQVISNDSARKILDLLAKKDYTETEIATELNLPISTVHYNLKQLAESGLVETNEYHYSQKGREIQHYSLANKYIIIAPKNTEGIAARLKHILPVALIVAFGSLVIKIINPGSTQLSTEMPMSMSLETTMAAKAAPIVSQTSQTTSDISLWFLAGGMASIAIFIIYQMVDYKLSNSKKQ